MNRETILDEIRRAAKLTPDGKIGLANFEKISGISQGVWRGKYWTNWSQAVVEAGCNTGNMSVAYTDDYLLKSLAELVRIYKHFPTYAEIKIQKNSTTSFPNHSVFDRLGLRPSKIKKLRRFVEGNPNYKDILDFLPENASVGEAVECEDDSSSPRTDGHVYMLKLSKHYKIGHTSSVPRRHREINLELPEKTDIVHVIATDDPEGIEAYWHRRFASKNTNGEWFALNAEDIRAFKRRKFM
jgi:Meiotically up-regulated gene 113